MSSSSYASIAARSLLIEVTICRFGPRHVIDVVEDFTRLAFDTITPFSMMFSRSSLSIGFALRSWITASRRQHQHSHPGNSCPVSQHRGVKRGKRHRRSSTSSFMIFRSSWYFALDPHMSVFAIGGRFAR